MPEDNTVIIAEPDYSPKAVAFYKKLGPVRFWFDLAEKDRKKYMRTVEILVVRLALTVNADLIGAMPNLKVIATSTTGLNHIDTAYAANRGITVVSLRGHTSFLRNVPSTAELTMGLIIALMRKILWAFDDVKNGNWQSTLWSGDQLYGKTMGIVGLGRLGTLVASYARAFGMKVIAADPNVSAVEMQKRGVRKVSMPALFKAADVVSLHVFLDDDTHNLITPEHFCLMKPGAYFINTARAELVEKDALVEALEKRMITGAAVDVLYDERDDGRHLHTDRLVTYAKAHDNLIITPHIGGATREARWATQEFIAKLVSKKLAECGCY